MFETIDEADRWLQLQSFVLVMRMERVVTTGGDDDPVAYLLFRRPRRRGR